MVLAVVVDSSKVLLLVSSTVTPSLLSGVFASPSLSSLWFRLGFLPQLCTSCYILRGFFTLVVSGNQHFVFGTSRHVPEVAF